MKKLLFLPLLLLASETEIESKAALFNGNDLMLQGEVYLNHPLGKMWAYNANLIDYQSCRETTFSQIDLTKNVKLLFHKGAELHCDSAHIDMETQVGSVTSEGRVSFSDQINGTAVTLHSKEVTFQASRESVENVCAKEQVDMEFLNGYRITCHEAIYKKTPHPTITAAPQNLQVCTIERDLDLIEGDNIFVDLEEKQISVSQSLGRLTSPKSPLHFSAEKLTWNDIANTLALKDNVWISSQEGNLSCENCVTLEQSTRFGKREITRLWAEGRTIFTTGSNVLVSPATLLINRDESTVELMPAELTSEEAIILSDSAHITYSEGIDGIRAETMHFVGNVYLRTKDPDAPLKRALCDRLDYDPTTQNMILSSNHSKNVLYWDEKEETQMSATEIYIDWPTVKGVGTVHFTFNKEEEERWFSKQKI